MGKRGRYKKVDYWRTPDGREVHGLKRRPDGRFYAADKPTKTFGTDPFTAVMRFMQWQSKKTQSAVVFKRQLPTDIGQDAEVARIIDGQTVVEFEVDNQGQLFQRQTILEETVWKTVGDLIKRSPQMAAEKLGIEQIGYLQDLKPPVPSTLLAAVGDRYLSRLRGEEVRKFRLHWKEFCRSVMATTVRDLTEPILSSYADNLLKCYAQEKVSWHYVQKRLSHVKSAFYYARSRFPDRDDINRVLEWCRYILKPPRRRVVNKPNPIGRDDLLAVLDVCEERMEAAILLALNIGGYPIDIATCKRAFITFHDKLCKHVYMTHRAKTGQLRIAVLWDRTVRAIEEMKRSNPHDLDLLFASANGTPWTAQAIRRMFNRRRDEAGVDATVKFDSLRDATKTRAIEGGARNEHTRIILGHANPGQDDNYLARTPEIVAEACAAVERYYFD